MTSPFGRAGWRGRLRGHALHARPILLQHRRQVYGRSSLTSAPPIRPAPRHVRQQYPSGAPRPPTSPAAPADTSYYFLYINGLPIPWTLSTFMHAYFPRDANAAKQGRDFYGRKSKSVWFHLPRDARRRITALILVALVVQVRAEAADESSRRRRHTHTHATSPVHASTACIHTRKADSSAPPPPLAAVGWRARPRSPTPSATRGTPST